MIQSQDNNYYDLLVKKIHVSFLFAYFCNSRIPRILLVHLIIYVYFVMYFISRVTTMDDNDMKYCDLK